MNKNYITPRCCHNPCCYRYIPCRPIYCLPVPPCPPSPQTYSVVYNPNGGFGGTADFNLPAGSSYTIKTSAEAGVSRPGYVFTTWNTQPNGSGTIYVPGDAWTITDNLILYAQWEMETPGTVTVIYDPNDGSGGLVDPGIVAGSNYTIKNQLETNISRTGYTFTGWNTEPHGSGIAYAPGDTLPLSSDLILYAQWEVQTYTVTYHNNPPPGFSNNLSYTTPPIPVDTAYLIPTAATLGFSFPNHFFVEWNTEPNGYGLTFPAGVSYAFNVNTDLYAIWIRDR